jgi:hypothetical protein
VDPGPIIAAVLGTLFGGGGIAALVRWGPDRTAAVVGYQVQMIESLQRANTYFATENGRLMAERGVLLGRIIELETRVEQLELGQDDPPGHMA